MITATRTLKLGSTGSDVSLLQRALGITADGWYGPATAAAVLDYQRKMGLVADGVAGPKTQGLLAGNLLGDTLLKEADIEAAAATLGVSVAHVKAVNAVESVGRGFLPNGKPKVLFERHVLHRLAKAARLPVDALAARYPNLINPARGGYIGGSAEHERIAMARSILPPEHAALAWQAASWGCFQIMGYHWEALGYGSPAEFVEAMQTSEGEHLDAFVRFIRADTALWQHLKLARWADFAKGYNGPAYKDNAYDTKLAVAFERFGGRAPVAVPKGAPQSAKAGTAKA